jgi:hypothetical protein
MLLGQPERALPLLTRAQRLSQSLQDSSEGWLCSRGRRTQVFALLLRGEARRAIHTKRHDNADWIEDVRLAAKVSHDESRPFSGIPIDSTVQALRYPAASGPHVCGTDNAAPFMMLPRLLHRLVHTYCGSLCVSIMSEVTSNSDVVGHSGGGHDAALLFWYDIASIFSVKTSFPCLKHLPNFCNEHQCWWPSNNDAHDASQPHTIPRGGAPCHQFDVEEEPVAGTERFQKVFYELLLSRKLGPETPATKKGVKPLFASRATLPDSTQQETTPGVWGAESASSAGSLPRSMSSSSLRNRLFRTGGTKDPAARTPTAFAFNSSFPLKESKLAPAAPERASSSANMANPAGFGAAATAAPSSARRNTVTSTINVFDRLTTPNSARGHRSFELESTDLPDKVTTRPTSARQTKSYESVSNSQTKDSVVSRPSSARLKRSSSVVGGSESARRSESRLAHSMRDRVSSAR